MKISNISMRTENSKISDSNRFRLYFIDKIDLRGNKKIALSDLSIHYTWYNIKEQYNNNKFRLSGPTCSEDVTILGGSYKIYQIQNYFLDEVIKKHESNVKSNEQSPILIYDNRILNRVSFRIKTGYKLELLSNETMRLLGDGPIIDTTKNGENVPKLEVVTNVLVFCNLVENVHLQDSKLLFSFVPNSRFESLLSITPQVLKYCDTVDSIFDYIEISFADQNGRPSEIDNDITVTIIIKNKYA